MGKHKGRQVINGPTWHDKLAPLNSVRAMEAARQIGASKNQMQAWIDGGKVKSFRIGRRIFVTHEEIARVKDDKENFKPVGEPVGWRVSPSIRNYRIFLRQRELARRRITRAGVKTANSGGDSSALGLSGQNFQSQENALVQPPFKGSAVLSDRRAERPIYAS